MRVRAAVARAAAVAIIGCAGCSSGPAHQRSPAPSPGRSTATATSPMLSGVSTAMVPVAGSPFGVAVTPDGRWAFVAGATADLSVVSVAAALAGKPAAVGLIPAGQFPREMALEPDGQRLLVSNYASGQLEAVSIPSIP